MSWNTRCRTMIMALAAVACTSASLATVRTVAASGADFTSIQMAINGSAPGDTIKIIESPHTENSISVTVSVTIEGLSATQTIVQAAAAPHTAGQRIFSVASGKVVTFQDMTLQNGDAYAGGCIYCSGLAVGPTVTVARCNLINNWASGAGNGTDGGAIYYNTATDGHGTLTIVDSTFAGNVVSNSLGSANNVYGGAIASASSDLCTIRNCTFSSNRVITSSSWQYGGAVNLGPSAGKTAVVQNCSFVTNSIIYTSGSQSGGGAIAGNGNTYVESCVLAGNVGGNSVISSVNYSNCVYEGAVYYPINLGGNLSTGNAKVNPVLAYNGGPTMTHALLAGSPAIDHGSNPAGIPYDQRGTGYNRTINSITDCGAYEYKSGPIGLVYSTNIFHEATANDGSIDNSSPMIITLTGNDSFTGAIGTFNTNKVAVLNLPGGLFASFQKTADQTLSVTLTNKAANNNAADSAYNLTFAFLDTAFSNNPASAVGSSSNAALQVAFLDPTLKYLTYSTNAFFEAAANDGSIATTPTVSITLFSTTFTGSGSGENFVTNNKVLVSNLPGGLTAVVSRVDDTHLTATLTGNAAWHNSASNVVNLTFAFQDAAFAGGGASSVSNATNAHLTITFADPVLTYNGSGAFTEAAANDGSIGNSFTITLIGDTFTGSVNDNFAGSKVTLSTPPGGLAWKVNRDSATQLTVSLTGNAGAQSAANNVSGLTLALLDSAFAHSTAAVVTNNSYSGYSISFLNPTLTYSATSFYESTANDGTVPDTAIITLAGDTLTGATGDDFVGSKVTVTNVPSGLTAKIQKTSATQVTVSFTGVASPSDATANRTNVTFAFQSAAFANSTVGSVTNATKSNLSVLFRNAYYVNQSIGNDANDGTANDASHAWQTLTNAVVRVPVNSVINIMYSPHTESNITVGAGMVFQGQGAKSTIVQAAAAPGAASARLFNVTASAQAVIFQDLTIRNGRAPGAATAGGAIYCAASANQITLSRCSFEKNESEGYGGGAVYVNGSSLAVNDSTFWGNFTTNNVGNDGAAGGGVYAQNAYNVTVANSTFSQNAAEGAYGWDGGGGALCIGTAAGYTALVCNCTFYSNAVLAAGQGGAIRGSSSANPLVTSCVFANNSVIGSTTDNAKGSSMKSCAFTNCVYQDAYDTAYGTVSNLGGSISTNNAGISPALADNGGQTRTHALLPGSAAIDHGSNPAGLPYDQRGKPYQRMHGAAVDAGAFEYGSGAPRGTTLLFR